MPGNRFSIRREAGSLDRRDKLKLVLLCLLIPVILAAFLLLIRTLEKSTGDTFDDSPLSWELFHRTVIIDGVKYRERSGLETYLLLGIDTTGNIQGEKATGGAGQADVQMVLVLDNQNETWRVLQLNRDALAEIPILGMNGQVVKYAQAQLALAYAYGSDGASALKNATDAVSRLLMDQEIDGTLAVNMDSIALITDSLGGITVTMPVDYTVVNENWTEGSVWTLTGEEAENFIRQRYDIGDRTNLTRMERQIAFWDPLCEKLLSLPEEKVEEMTEALEDRMVSTIDTGAASKLQNKLKSYTNLGILTIDGENMVLEEHWAYEMDEDSLNQTVLALFFEKTAGQTEGKEE